MFGSTDNGKRLIETLKPLNTQSHQFPPTPHLPDIDMLTIEISQNPGSLETVSFMKPLGVSVSILNTFTLCF